jgi:hypothetical protein
VRGHGWLVALLTVACSGESSRTPSDGGPVDDAGPAVQDAPVPLDGAPVAASDVGAILSDVPLTAIDGMAGDGVQERPAVDGRGDGGRTPIRPPTPGPCVRVDDGQGAFPSLHAVAGRWFAFFTEGTGTTAALRVRSAVVPALDFGPAATVLYGATKVDMIDDGGTLWALASRQFYAVLLQSVDGSTWTEGGNIATSAIDALCTGYTPAGFSRGAHPAAFVAAGSDYNTRIFGCAPQVVVAWPGSGGWSTPVTIGKGYPVLALASDGLLTVAATFGVYLSRDQGLTWSQVPGGDTTAEQVRGTSGALAGSTLLLAQSYSYGTSEPNRIAVIASDDGGASWPRQVALAQSSDYPGDPLMAADGSFVAVAWQMGDAIMVVLSIDAGLTWTRPATVKPSLDGGVAQLGGLAASGTTVALAVAGAGVQICRLD